jgi:hypothetical protein
MEKINIDSEQFDIPILLLVFNRIDTLEAVFDAIKKQKPHKLYVAGDGARLSNIDEFEQVSKVRNYILDGVDWPCEVKTLFREKNIGCGKAVSEAITWFFEHEEMGIILEDDCVPCLDFFIFCKNLLIYYKYDERIWEISGTNLQGGIKRGEASYYYSNYGGIWGWASWARSWKNYDFEMRNYDKFVKEKRIEHVFKSKVQQKYWIKNLKQLKELDTWDFQWFFAHIYYNGLCIVPNINLIQNIGFNQHGTHTKAEPHWYKTATASNGLMGKIIHPKNIKVDKNADDFLFRKYIKPASLFKIGLNYLKKKFSA